MHAIEGTTGGPRNVDTVKFRTLRQHFGGPWMVNNGYTRELALAAAAGGEADAIAFGRAFIANPDLTHRLRHDLALAVPDRKTFYGGGAAGYTDYPACGDAPADPTPPAAGARAQPA